jgi:tetratricopeptide (TPR) repeat protein
MALAMNPLFTGREGELRALAAALQAGRTVVVTGTGGMGKSQLVVEFVHRYGPSLAGGVFWLSFAEQAGIAAEVARCGGPDGMALPGLEARDLPAQAQRVRAEWRREIPRLLVFDNCEEAALLAEWRPVTGGCRVVVTSRVGRWPPELGVRLLPLTELPRPASVRLLQKYFSPLQPAEADAIAEELGDLPLALALAGSFLARYGQSVAPADYLAQLRERASDRALLAHPSLKGRGLAGSGATTRHALDVGRSFALSYERLRSDSPADALARATLARAACFAPGEPIPRPLLIKTLFLGGGEEAALRAEEAIGRLVELGLLEEVGSGALRLHRLVAAFAQESGDPAGRLAQQAVEEVVADEAQRLNDAGFPAAVAGWQAHLRHITEVARPRQDSDAARLAAELGTHLHQVGDLAGARPYMEQALALFEQAAGPEHADTASSLNNLGALLHDLGELVEALPYHERALAIREKRYGPSHPNTAASLTNRGALRQARGDLAGARADFERALAVREQALGLEHPDTAQSLNNLGTLRQGMGELAAARPLFERALAVHEKTLGPEHPDVATDRNNLGLLLHDLGDPEGARLHLERALAIREKALGPEHPDMAQSVNNLAVLLHDLGELAAARPLYERALRLWEKALGSEHPDVGRALNNLGQLLQAMGDADGARPLLERSLAVWEAAQGPEHPGTAEALNALAMLRAELGDADEARALLERALAIRERALGPAHPATAESLNNLGGFYYSMRELATARRYFAQALALFEQALGPQHPTTRVVRANLERAERER